MLSNGQELGYRHVEFDVLFDIQMRFQVGSPVTEPGMEGEAWGLPHGGDIENHERP